jgi:hypothetical protein
VVPFFDEHDVKLCRMLTDRGTEFCGTSQAHEYELYLAVEDIDHSRTKTRSRQAGRGVGPKSGSQQTPRWREPDSKPRSRAKSAMISRTRLPTTGAWARDRPPVREARIGSIPQAYPALSDVDRRSVGMGRSDVHSSTLMGNY